VRVLQNRVLKKILGYRSYKETGDIYYSGNHTKEDEMDEACSTLGRDFSSAGLCFETLKKVTTWNNWTCRRTRR
jgi:hypothetical protein